MWDGVTDRKMCLFVAACLRHVWHLLRDVRSRRLVEVLEQYADGRIGQNEFDEASAAAADYFNGTCVYGTSTGDQLGRAVVFAAEFKISLRMEGFGNFVDQYAKGIACLRASDGDDYETVAKAARGETEQIRQHIIGVASHHPRDALYPSTVLELAHALYDRADCLFAFHDALLESGNVQLAEHFHKEDRHPKGCWALDLILNKE